MSIDPKGTQPGLAKKPDEPETHHMKCRNPKCGCMTATEMKIGGGPGQHVYRCTKCGHSWGVALGGYVGF